MFLSPFLDGDVTVNFENSNGHMIPIGEESTREENVVRSEEGNGSVAEKTTPLEEKAEDKKGKIEKPPNSFTAQSWEAGLGLHIVTLRPVERSSANTRREMITSKEKWDAFLR